LIFRLTHKDLAFHQNQAT